MILIILIYLYLLYGFYQIYHKQEITTLYIAILTFMTFKIIADYRVCTIAYAECKLRKVERHESYINMVLDPMIDVRYTKQVYLIVGMSLIIMYYYFIHKNKLKDFMKSVYGSEKVKVIKYNLKN